MKTKRDLNHFPKIWIDVLAFVALLLGAFFIYRNGIAALPRADQVNFLREREFLSSDWEYFWHMLARNRGTSFLISADIFLFRPLFHAFLVVVDIFFRDNLYVTGAIGILLHGIVCFSVYLLISELTNRLFSFLSAVFLLTQYIGIEMIHWTHINGYLIALALFTFGFFFIFQSQKSGKLNILPVVLLFLCASLIHELFAHVLFLSSLVFAFSFKDIQKKKIWLICFLPFVLYLFLDILSLLYSKPDSFFSSLDQPAGLTLSNILLSTLFLSGVFLTVFFLPNIVQLSEKNLLLQAHWDVTTLSPLLINVMGLGLILLLVTSFLFFLKRYQRETNGRMVFFALGIVITIYMMIMILELVVGRIALRSFDYMKSATYYYYLSNYAFLMIAGLLYREFRESNWLNQYSWKRSLLVVMPFFILWQIPYSYPKIQEFVKKNATEKVAAYATLRVANYIRQNKGLCYGGAFDTMFWALAPDHLFYRVRCIDDMQEPRYGMLSPDKQPWLLKLNIKKDIMTPVSLTPNDFSQETVSLFSPLPVSESLKNRTILVSKESRNPVYFSVSFNGVRDSGLLIGYRDPQNFVLLKLARYQLFLFVVENGQIKSRQVTRPYYWNGNNFKLSVIKTSNSCLFLFNNNVLAWFGGISSLEGRFGFYFSEANSGEKVLSKPLVYEPSFGEGNPIVLEPDMNLIILDKNLVG